MALAYFVEKHYDTTGWTRKDIATELFIQESLIEKSSR